LFQDRHQHSEHSAVTHFHLNPGLFWLWFGLARPVGSHRGRRHCSVLALIHKQHSSKQLRIARQSSMTSKSYCRRISILICSLQHLSFPNFLHVSLSSFARPVMWLCSCRWTLDVVNCCVPLCEAEELETLREYTKSLLSNCVTTKLKFVSIPNSHSECALHCTLFNSNTQQAPPQPAYQMASCQHYLSHLFPSSSLSQ